MTKTTSNAKKAIKVKTVKTVKKPVPAKEVKNLALAATALAAAGIQPNDKNLSGALKAVKTADAKAATVKAPKAVKTLTEKHADEIDSGILWMILDAREAAGGSYNELEDAFALRKTNGNTAWRLIRRAEKIRAEK